MRLLLEPIEVGLRQGEPAWFRWRQVVHPVRRVLLRWCWRGRWWHDPTLEGERRWYFRLACPAGVFEVFRRRLGGPSADAWPPAPTDSWPTPTRTDDDVNQDHCDHRLQAPVAPDAPTQTHPIGALSSQARPDDTWLLSRVAD